MSKANDQGTLRPKGADSPSLRWRSCSGRLVSATLRAHRLSVKQSFESASPRPSRASTCRVGAGRPSAAPRRPPAASRSRSPRRWPRCPGCGRRRGRCRRPSPSSWIATTTRSAADDGPPTFGVSSVKGPFRLTDGHAPDGATGGDRRRHGREARVRHRRRPRARAAERRGEEVRDRRIPRVRQHDRSRRGGEAWPPLEHQAHRDGFGAERLHRRGVRAA